jgi:hypothetical protein
MKRSMLLRSLLALGGCLVLALQGAAQPTAANTAHLTPSTLNGKNGGKLSARLYALAQSPQLRAATARIQAEALSLAAEGPGSLLKDGSGGLLVDIRLGAVTDEALSAITSLGATVVNIANEYRTVTAYVDVGILQSIEQLPAVENIREVIAPMSSMGANRRAGTTPLAPAIGAQTSEGDSQVRAATARANYGVDGTGVKVGVISDSYNKAVGEPTTAANDVASGDLPGVGNPLGHTIPVSVISETNQSGMTDEGRGMPQIVHDLAPGASLAFATAWEGDYAFAANIRNLRSSGAHIIVDDVSYFNEPFYQEGPIAVAISDVVGAGAMYFTSAGNSNEIVSGNNVASYEAPAYRSMACPIAFYTGETCHDFDPGAGSDSGQDITLANNGYIQAILQWAQPWFGVTTDFDVYLLNSSNGIVAKSEDTNTGASGTQQPFEYMQFQNTTGSAQTYRIVIGRYVAASGGDTGTPRLKYLFIGSNGINSVQFNVSNSGDTVGPTIYGHSSSRYSLSVAATPYNNDVTPETYSSRGPATHYFGPVINTTAAAATAAVPIQQPDFTATDGGCTTFFGSSAGGGCYRFYGTSAAAPHAAAVAALMKQKANQRGIGMSQSSVKSFLQATARAMGGGNLNSVGAGLIDANAAVGRINQMTYKAYVPLARR